MGEPETPHFYDFWISGRVPEPKKQYDLSLEAPGHLKEIKKNPTHLKTKHLIFRNIKKFGNPKR